MVQSQPERAVGYDYDAYEDRLAADEYLNWTRQWGAALVRALKPTGTFWLAIGDDFAAELKLIFQRELGLACRSWVIWYYTFGVNCKKKFSRSHTHLFHFVKNPREFTFNAAAVRVPSARQLVYADIRADNNGRLPDDTWILRPQDLETGFHSDEDTWYFPRVCGTFKERAGWHGCQMPEQLLGRIIKSCSNPGELVLDPFGGSGTTLAVAKKLGRKFIGFELSKSYAAKIQSRLGAISVGDALSGAEEPKVSAPTTKKGKKRTDVKSIVPAFAAIRTEPGDVNRGVVEAFFAARDGFPVDRVIADPDLNARFVEICGRLGLPGKPHDWNHRLMNLRKSGYFKGLPRPRGTMFPLEVADFDRYGFACEIALEKFRAKGTPFDQVLCEPDLASQFDELVRSMIPEPLTSLKIRWFALRIRKRSNRKDYKERVRKRLNDIVTLPRIDNNPFSLSVPASPGLYWLRGEDRHLYVGETSNLCERLKAQFSPNRFDFWGVNKQKLELGYRRVDNEDVLMPNQSIWIWKWNPEGNLQDLLVNP
ncbi:MAG: site-specific DNA-methyltransferase [Planctomycetota bacterium]|nr:site-specific DNA-methyltransferase [Planctomycetota bacterium]